MTLRYDVGRSFSSASRAAKAARYYLDSNFANGYRSSFASAS